MSDSKITRDIIGLVAALDKLDRNDDRKAEVEITVIMSKDNKWQQLAKYLRKRFD